MSTLENLFVQIFERKKRIVKQVKQQAGLYEQNLASKLLILGINPPSWFLDSSFRSHAQDLKREELISGILSTCPRPLPPSSRLHCSTCNNPIVTETYLSNNVLEVVDTSIDISHIHDDVQCINKDLEAGDRSKVVSLSPIDASRCVNNDFKLGDNLKVSRTSINVVSPIPIVVSRYVNNDFEDENNSKDPQTSINHASLGPIDASRYVNNGFEDENNSIVPQTSINDVSLNPIDASRCANNGFEDENNSKVPQTSINEVSSSSVVASRCVNNGFEHGDNSTVTKTSINDVIVTPIDASPCVNNGFEYGNNLTVPHNSANDISPSPIDASQCVRNGFEDGNNSKAHKYSINDVYPSPIDAFRCMKNGFQEKDDSTAPQNSITGIYDPNISASSPPNRTNITKSDVHPEPYQSLARIQRSKSRQKALELRNSAKAVDKIHSNETQSAGVDSNRNLQCKIDLQQPIHVSELLECARSSHITNDTCEMTDVIEDFQINEKCRSTCTDRITASKSWLQSDGVDKCFEVNRLFDVSKGCCDKVEHSFERSVQQSKDVDETSGVREAEIGNCQSEAKGKSVHRCTGTSRFFYLSPNRLNEFLKLESSYAKVRGYGSNPEQSLAKSAPKPSPVIDLLESIKPLDVTNGSCKVREVYVGDIECKEKSNTYGGRITRSKSSCITSSRLNESLKFDRFSDGVKEYGDTPPQSFGESPQQLKHVHLQNAHGTHISTRKSSSSSVEDVNLCPLRAMEQLSKQNTHLELAYFSTSIFENLVKGYKGSNLNKLWGDQASNISCTVVSNDQERYETTIEETGAISDGLGKAHFVSSGGEMDASISIPLPVETVFVQPKKLDFNDFENCILNSSCFPLDNKVQDKLVETRSSTLLDPTKIVSECSYPDIGITKSLNYDFNHVFGSPKQFCSQLNVSLDPDLSINQSAINKGFGSTSTLQDEDCSQLNVTNPDLDIDQIVNNNSFASTSNQKYKGRSSSERTPFCVKLSITRDNKITIQDSHSYLAEQVKLEDATSIIHNVTRQFGADGEPDLSHGADQIDLEDVEELNSVTRNIEGSLSYIEPESEGLSSGCSFWSPYNPNLDFASADETKTVFEEFIIPTKNVEMDGISFNVSGLPMPTIQHSKVCEEICRYSSNFSPLFQFSNAYNLHRTPNLQKSVPNGILEHKISRSTLTSDNSYHKKLSASYSDCEPFTSFRNAWSIRPYTSPVGKLWEGVGFRFSSSGSQKRKSSNPELTCFPIEEEESGNADEIVHTFPKNEGLMFPDNLAEHETLAEMKENFLIQGEKNENADDIVKSFHEKNSFISIEKSSKREPLAKIKEDILEPLVSTAEMCAKKGSLESTDNEIGFMGIHDCVNNKPETRYSKRRFTEDCKTQYLSVDTKCIKRVTESLRSRVSKPKLSKKKSSRNKGLGMLEKPSSKRNNIVSNVTSFIPLVQQKLPSAAVTGKRDVKVKALEAAEAAKHLEVQRENERKMKKEAMKLQRARLEQKKKLEQMRKIKEDEQKKDAEIAMRKRLREEEERKEKERKRKRLEEAKKRPKEDQKKLRADKDQNQIPRQYEKKMEDEFERCVTVEKESTLIGNCGASMCGDIEKEIITLDIPNNNCTTNSSQERSYEISPYQESDDEDEEDDISNTKIFPSWASKSNLAQAIFEQTLDPRTIFPRESFCHIDEVLLPRKLPLV